MGKRGPTEAGSIARATWRAMLVEVVGWIRRHALLSLAAGTIFIVLLAVAVGGPLRRLAPLMAVALVLVWAVRRSGLFSSSLGDTGDVVVLTGAGRRLVVPWSQVKRVWMTSSRSIWSTQVSIQVETSDGVATQRTTLPIAEPGLVVAVFRQLSQSTAFLAACEARGVDVRLGSSGLPDTEPGLVVSWASLYDVVQREPHRYGGVHQGPDNTGILQVVRGQTRLTPGRHIGAVVADAVGIPARDLMADVIVVECRHSLAELVHIRDDITRLARAQLSLGISSVQVVGRDNVVAVNVSRLGVLIAAAFDRFGDAVRLVERPTAANGPIDPMNWAPPHPQ